MKMIIGFTCLCLLIATYGCGNVDAELDRFKDSSTGERSAQKVLRYSKERHRVNLRAETSQSNYHRHVQNVSSTIGRAKEKRRQHTQAGAVTTQSQAQRIGKYPISNVEDSFYKTFDEVVHNITQGISIDNEALGKCACTKERFIFCNCSNMNLKSVPSDVPLDVQGLDFSRNGHSLRIAPFKKYSQLRYLSLKESSIRRLRSDYFSRLDQLIALDLGDNRLEMGKNSYPDDVFEGLTSLVALRINRNIPQDKVRTRSPEYPGRSLAPLKSLRLLSMDGLYNKTFGKEFQNMTSLETLSLAGYLDGTCYLNYLSNATFAYFGELKMLNISNCNIVGGRVDSGVFVPLKKLQTLDLSWNQAMTINHLTRILTELRNSNLKELHVKYVEPRYSPGMRICSHHVDKLPHSLTKLVVSGNSISEIDPDVLERLPKSLQHLDISSNRMVFGEYLVNLTLLTNLETLDINGMEHDFPIPRKYPKSYLESKQPRFGYQIVPSEDSEIKNDSNLVLQLPPKLRSLSMMNADLTYILSELTVNENNSLQELYMDGNNFKVLRGPLRGFRKLEYMSFTGCNIESIDKSFFSHLPLLEHLDLYSNHIGKGKSLFHQPFEALSNLTYLNLNFNAIEFFHNDSFKGLFALKELHARDNFFYFFNASISHMKQLEILDVSRTELYQLPEEARKHLDSLQHSQVTVFMQGDPLSCACENIEFLKWMIQSTAIPKDYDYKCILSITKYLVLPWESYVEEVKNIQRECTPKYKLFLVVVGATIITVILTIATIVYRFRWRLRYLYYGLHLRMTSKNDADEHKFAYDVFLSYSSDDLNFVLNKVCPELRSRNLTVCIHDKDFLAGDHITTNILRSVRKCRRTLIVLTQNLLDSKWCRCEFQIAKEESVVTGRRILVFLLAEKIPKNKLGLELLDHIRQNTYLPYPGTINNQENLREEERQPSEDRDMKLFWDKLANDLRA